MNTLVISERMAILMYTFIYSLHRRLLSELNTIVCYTRPTYSLSPSPLIDHVDVFKVATDETFAFLRIAYKITNRALVSSEINLCFFRENSLLLVIRPQHDNISAI